MTQCRHTHYNTTADILTKLAAVGEITTSFISDTYWIAGLIDLAQFDDNGYGLSWYGLGFGMALAIVTSAGSAYSHICILYLYGVSPIYEVP